MKIDGNNPYILPEVQNPQRDNPGHPGKTQDSTAQRDRLEFSVAGKELQSLTQKAVEASVVRAERIAEIKLQVDAGTYNIKAREIAEAIITGSLVDENA